MKSKTSLFNKYIYKKDMQIFSILSVLFLIVLTLCQPLKHFYDLKNANVLFERAYDMAGNTNFIDIFLICAIPTIVATLVFSYLHKPNHCVAYHALPTTRKSLFITSYIAGITLMFVPVIITYVLNLAVCASFGVLSVAFWGVTLNCAMYLLTMLVCYSVAIFFNMITGNKYVAMVFYVIFNLLPLYLLFAVDGIFDKLTFGYSSIFSNVFHKYFSYLPFLMADKFDSVSFMFAFVYVILSAFIAYIAYILYKKRNVETAGDFLSFKVAKPIFRYGIAVCAGILLYFGGETFFSIGDSLFGSCALLVIGGIIGYFISEMLMQKRFKVFKCYKGAIVYTVAIVLVMVGINNDFIGYEKRMPKVDDVAFVTVCLPEQGLYLNNYKNYTNDMSEAEKKAYMSMPEVITNSENIANVLQLHKTTIDNKKLLKNKIDGNVHWNYGFKYTLKNGSILERYYYITGDDNGKLMMDYMNKITADREYVEKYAQQINNLAGVTYEISVSKYDKISGNNINYNIEDRANINDFTKAFEKDLRKELGKGFITMENINNDKIDDMYNVYYAIKDSEAYELPYSKQRFNRDYKIKNSYKNSLEALEKYGTLLDEKGGKQ